MIEICQTTLSASLVFNFFKINESLIMIYGGHSQDFKAESRMQFQFLLADNVDCIEFDLNASQNYWKL